MTQGEIIEMPEYLNASYEGDDLYTGDQVRELMKLVAAKEREVLETELLKLKKGIAANSDYIQGRWDLIGEFQDIIRARGEA